MIVLKSCKHLDNQVSIWKDTWGNISVSWKWENSWKDSNIVDWTLNDIEIILNYGTDNDITLTFEKWIDSIPIVIWCPWNNSWDKFNEQRVYSALYKLKVGNSNTVKWESIKRKILEILF
jgi:hypothetical protein